MLTREQNEALTRVEGEAPMGRLMRKWAWIPFAIPSQIKVGEAPLKVRLLGEDFVAWRAPDGRIGFIDRDCPHRGASMALARNEGCVLRCIFHGWTVDVSGKVVEALTHQPDPEAFAARVKVNHYPVREAGGLVWVWLGGEPVAEFPKLPFFELPEGHVWMTVTKAACNWLQGVEASLDSAHVGTLHKSWVPRQTEFDIRAYGSTRKANFLQALAPRYEVDRTPWGMSAIALREMPDGSNHLRATQYVAPYINMVPRAPYGNGSLFIAVPVDDENHLLFFGFFSRQDQIGLDTPRVAAMVTNGRFVLEDYAPVKAGREDNYGQDRELMAQGHHSGFGENLLVEDMVTQISMGPIRDRTRDHLSSSDVAIVQARLLLLQALRNDAEGRHPLAPADPRYLMEDAMPVDALAPPDSEWRKVLAGQRQTA